ncbi:MAG TPA: acetyl-CoA carboxylase carboxyltransferase subunit alpha, partial [Chloroflexota bacterium]|nr:acetyl-CoA carboxylase carboxyltransferase subunit alpha [Chloroflexota bacterium]
MEPENTLDQVGVEAATSLPGTLGEQVVTIREEPNGHQGEPSSSRTAWETVQLARHRDRPYTLDFARWMLSDFVELHGDRRFGDDRAILGGPALLDGRAVMLVGHQKGRTTRENVTHNFGMPNPEGYRKAMRLFQHAARLGMPIVTLIDTPGANPSLPAEERGQAQAIAESIAVLLSVPVPVVAVITGEGGSGGALAIATADRILMLENAIFTVASPEAAASILWRDAREAPQAAAAMKIMAHDLVELGIVDEVVREPGDGAHSDHAATGAGLRRAVSSALDELSMLSAPELLRRRREKYRRIGDFSR